MGSYHVILAVRDDAGAEDRAQVPVTVKRLPHRPVEEDDASWLLLLFLFALVLLGSAGTAYLIQRPRKERKKEKSYEDKLPGW